MEWGVINGWNLPDTLIFLGLVLSVTAIILVLMALKQDLTIRVRDCLALGAVILLIVGTVLSSFGFYYLDKGICRTSLPEGKYDLDIMFKDNNDSEETYYLVVRGISSNSSAIDVQRCVELPSSTRVLLEDKTFELNNGNVVRGTLYVHTKAETTRDQGHEWKSSSSLKIKVYEVTDMVIYRR